MKMIGSKWLLAEADFHERRSCVPGGMPLSLFSMFKDGVIDYWSCFSWRLRVFARGFPVPNQTT